MTLQVVRDWVLRFNERGPDGPIDRKAPGKLPLLNKAHRAALAAVIESGPIPAAHSVVRWRIIDLCQWIWDEFAVSVSKQTLGRELRAMGYRKLSARPRHLPRPLSHGRGAGEGAAKRNAAPIGAIEALKKILGHAGGGRAPAWPRSRRRRGLVRRRLSSAGDQPDRAEKQDHAALGQARHAAQRAARPAHRVHLHLRRHLPPGGQGGRPDPALVQHRGDGPTSRGHLG